MITNHFLKRKKQKATNLIEMLKSKIQLTVFLISAIGYTSFSQCTQTISLYDSYGDGWHGDNFLTVSVNGTPVLTNITLSGGSGPENHTFSASEGDVVTISYTAGSYPSECYFDLTNDNGYFWVNDYYPNTSGNYSGSADCLSSLAPSYCTSYATSSGDTEIDNVVLNGSSINISNNTAGICATYSDFTGLAAPDLFVGSSYTISITAGTCSGSYEKGVKVFIDWNNDYDFDDANEEVGFSSTSVSTATFDIGFNVPAGAVVGNTRMRVIVAETTDPSAISACGTYSYGETEDYTINVSSPVAMSILSITSNQATTDDVSIGEINQVIIGIQIVTSGNLSPLELTELVLGTDGCDDYTVDISDAKIWYTGTNNSFSTSSQFGNTYSTPPAPGADMTFTGSQNLVPGINYFWLTYSIPTGATDGNYIDAVFNSANIQGVDYFPITSSPAGDRMIIDGCYHVLTLFDEVGDGWNGGAITVKVNGVNILTNYTLAAGSSASFNFVANTGDLIETVYTAGSFPEENRYLITNPNGAYIGSSGNDNEIPSNISAMGDCNAINEFSVNGDTYQSGTTCYIITEDLENQSGSVWSNFKIDLTNNFSIGFSLYLGEESGGEGADGTVFCLQGDCASAGGNGGSLGYGGISNSVAIEFDTYRNEDTNNDPDGDHIAIISNGSMNHLLSTNLNGPSVIGDLEDDAWHDVIVDWDASTNTLSMSFDGTDLLSYTGDIVNNILGGDPQVFWGFTAGTGLYHNRQEVCITTYPSNSTQISDTVICDGCTVAVEVSEGATSYSWTPDDGSISNPSIYNPVLSPDETTEYTVEIVDACGNILTDRFTVFVGLELLPVEFTEVRAHCNGADVKVEWETASEKNNDYFEVQKSLDARNWKTIKVVKGKGNSSTSSKYSVIDERSFNNSYYRIKQVDYDGEFSYSEIATANCGESEEDIHIYPNPAKDFVMFGNIPNENLFIQIVDGFGKVVCNETLSNKKDISFLTPGVYVIKINTESGITIKTERLIIL